MRQGSALASLQMRWKDTQSEFYPRHSDANASLMPDRLIGLFGEEILPERRGRPDAAEGEDKDYRVARSSVPTLFEQTQLVG
jgi:hypothetical protein